MSTSRTDSLTIDPQQVQTLLSQGALGHHVLFSMVQIRRALSKSLPLQNHGDVLDDLQSVFIELTQCDGLKQQQALIHALPEGLQDLVVRMYFHFLDQYIREQPLTWH